MTPSATIGVPDTTPQPRATRAVLVLVFVSLLVRCGALWLARDAQPWNDQVTYVQRATDILDGKGYTGSYQSWVKHPGERQLQTLPRYPGAYQAPGFPAFMALVMGVCGRDEMWIKCAQVALGAASTWLVFALGRTAYGARVGLIAGWLHALDPTFIAFTHYLFNETLFVFLFLLALHLLLRDEGLPSVASALAIGVVFALAVYVKSSLLYLLPVLAVWWWWRKRAASGRAALTLALAASAWCVCMAPWSIRNYQVHGGFVLVDSSGPYNLWRGNQPNAYARRRMSSDWNVRFPEPFRAYSVAPVSEVGGSKLVEVVQDTLHVDEPTDLEMMRGSQMAALEYMLEDPLWSAQRAWYKIVDVWNPTSFVMRHLFKGGHGEIPKLLEVALSWWCALSYLALLACALPALWLRRRDDFAMLAMLVFFYYTAIHAITFGLTRFRLPVMPFFMILAAVGIVTWIERRRLRGAHAT